jgi:hypothetical protein
MSKNFLKEYHSTVVKAAGEHAKKLNTKMGIIMANKFCANTSNFNNEEEFAQNFENYLKELEFAEKVNVYCDKENYILKIKGCDVCHGNEILRQEGIGTACPIVQTAKYAMLKKMRKNVILDGVDKPGPVGECAIRFELE